MSLVRLASIKDLQESKMMGVTNADKEILIVNLDGKYHAIGNKCAHKGCKLSNGVLFEESVECPCHGSVFNVKTGKIIKGPTKKPEPVFKVEVKEDQILVDL